MKPNLKDIQLPIIDVLPAICKELKTQSRLIIHAPPGAGKSTIVPLALLDEPWLQGNKVIILEPRRLAAKSIAVRMADLLGEQVGQRVGYRIRFETKVTKATQIEVVTEGILTRMLQSDNALEGVGAIIFDEFHERSIFADVSLALTLESQSILRPELRLVVMSATLDIPALKEKLDAPIVESLGRQYPVDVTHVDRHDVRAIPEMVAQTVVEAIASKEGDVLAFLPGEAEIKRCEGILKSRLDDVAVMPLYGQLPYKKQQQALRPHPEGMRKVVLATSIAETSLTIQGVSIVVDAGFERSADFDTRSGLPRLQTKEITHDTAQQRAGRAGRLGPGHCVRLWSKGKHNQLVPHREAEILRSDLTSLVLDLAAWGTTDAYELMWITPPPKGAIYQAKEVLQSLNVLDEKEEITPHGRKVHRLPCHPRIAHMLIVAQDHGLQHLACDVAAFIEERDPMGKEEGIDINIRIEMLRRLRRDQRVSRSMMKIEKVAESYRRILKVDVNNATYDPCEVGLLLAMTFPERIACARPGNNAQFQLSNGEYAMAHHSDDLAHESWLAIAHMNLREKTGRIFLAAPLNPVDLASMLKTREHIMWHSKTGEFVAEEELRIGSIVLRKTPIRDVDMDAKVSAICEVLKKDGAHLLNFDKTVTQWQNRIISLRQWDEALALPDVSTTQLLATIEDWIAPYLDKVRNANDLKKLPLYDILKSSLDWEQQQLIDKLAPEKITVPSGSMIKLEYRDNGAEPILAVRIQELFGLANTPTVNAGKNPVLLHLLSPGYKPLQVTSDLNSFWNNTYYEVRKEAKRRYPKHSWPDDPWTEQAVRGVKRKPRK